MAQHKRCPACDVQNAVSAVVCANCGASIVGVDISETPDPTGGSSLGGGKTCPECAAVNPEPATHCLYCQASLPPVPGEPGTRISLKWPWGEQVVCDGLRVGREPPAPDALIQMLRARGYDNVSRQHAEFRIEGGEAIIVDLGSSNGTFLDGKRLTAMAPERLPQRAIVRFGADLEVAVCVDTLQVSTPKAAG